MYEVEGSRPRGRPKRTWKEVVWEDCQARKPNKEDATDRCKWRKVIKEVRWTGWVWAGACFFWYRPTGVVPDKRPLNGCCFRPTAVVKWHGCVLIRKVTTTGWKYMEYLEVRRKKTWSEVVEKDRRARQPRKADAMDGRKYRVGQKSEATNSWP